jgi:hypothetical protein
MAEQKSEENIVFLPWTVEPQPQTQAVILHQPSETHLRLDATTDKTAISSFALSVVIALILGGFATWLAYWYGRKSFKLTEMSFHMVTQQIKSSEQSAIDLNNKIFEQQVVLQKNELAFKERIAWNEIVSTIAAECNILINNFIFKAQDVSKFYLRASSSDKSNPSSVFGQKLHELETINHQLILKIAKLDLYLDYDNEIHEYFIKILDYFTIFSDQLIYEFYNKSKVEMLDVFLDLSHVEYGDKKVLMLEGWKSHKSLNRLEILSLLMREINKSLKNNLRKKAA